MYKRQISVFEEESEEKALVADENIAKNKARPLEGIPIAHKDIFCIKDKKTTCGSKMLSNFISPYSSEVFSKLDTAGAITLGKQTWMNLLWDLQTKQAFMEMF